MPFSPVHPARRFRVKTSNRAAAEPPARARLRSNKPTPSPNSSQVSYAFYPRIVLQTPINTFTYGQWTFVATDANGNIYQSEAFGTDLNAPPTTLGISTYAGVTINGTAGGVYRIQCSTDLDTWQTLKIPCCLTALTFGLIPVQRCLD